MSSALRGESTLLLCAVRELSLSAFFGRTAIIDSDLHRSLDFGGGTVFGDSVLEPAHNLHHSELLDEPAPNKVALDSAELAFWL